MASSRRFALLNISRATTRVVLDVADVSDYSAFLLPNPYRLIIDIHGRQPQSQTLIAKANASHRPPLATTSKADHHRLERKVLPLGREGQRSQGRTKPRRQPPPTAKRSIRFGRDERIPAQPRSQCAGSTSAASSGSQAAAKSSSGMTTDDAVRLRRDTKRSTLRNPSLLTPFSGPKDTSGPELKATTQPTTAPTAVAVAPRASKKNAKNSAATAAQRTKLNRPLSAIAA